MNDLAIAVVVIVVLVVLACVVMNNLFHAKYAALISAAEASAKSDYGRITADITAALSAAESRITALIHGTTASTVATVNASAPVAAPVVPVPVMETMNGVPVPAGMTLASFTALVVATAGVAASLGNAALHDALVASSQAWWNALGDYFREEYLLRSTPEVYIALHALAAAPGAPAPLTITPIQQAAANLAAGVK